MLCIAALFCLAAVAASAQTSFTVFDGTGRTSSADSIVATAADNDVVFLGEMHDDAVAHQLQLEIFKKIVEKYSGSRTVILSLEMFERDVQTVLTEYLSGQISEQHFLLSSRPWPNYKTDYRPLVELAKERKIAVVAANAPRRYVNMVSRLGRESLLGLSPEAKSWLPPLPVPEPSKAYVDKFNALMGGSPESIAAAKPIIFSQALWDASMAYRIAEALNSGKRPLVVHLNGAFHTEKRLGTVEYLAHYRKEARAMVVTMLYEENFGSFDAAKHQGLGDFVVLTDTKVPRSR